MNEKRKKELMQNFMNFMKEELVVEDEDQWFCDMFNMTKEEIREIESDSNKVYLVILEWQFEGDSGVEIECFDTREKANEFFKKQVKEEKENSWIADCLKDDEYKENATIYKNGRYMVDNEEYYFNFYDSVNYDSTSIYIQEKELN